MSQEEEKLIEEWCEYCSCRPNIDVKSVRKAEEKISEAFRFGKLAGFEECKKVTDFWDTKGAIVHEIKSLIEEEKKKL